MVFSFIHVEDVPRLLIPFKTGAIIIGNIVHLITKLLMQVIIGYVAHVIITIVMLLCRHWGSCNQRKRIQSVYVTWCTYLLKTLGCIKYPQYLCARTVCVLCVWYMCICQCYMCVCVCIVCMWCVWVHVFVQCMYVCVVCVMCVCPAVWVCV